MSVASAQSGAIKSSFDHGGLGGPGINTGNGLSTSSFASSMYGAQAGGNRGMDSATSFASIYGAKLGGASGYSPFHTGNVSNSVSLTSSSSLHPPRTLMYESCQAVVSLWRRMEVQTSAVKRENRLVSFRSKGGGGGLS